MYSNIVTLLVSMGLVSHVFSASIPSNQWPIQRQTTLPILEEEIRTCISAVQVNLDKISTAIEHPPSDENQAQISLIRSNLHSINYTLQKTTSKISTSSSSLVLSLPAPEIITFTSTLQTVQDITSNLENSYISSSMNLPSDIWAGVKSEYAAVILAIRSLANPIGVLAGQAQQADKIIVSTALTALENKAEELGATVSRLLGHAGIER